jgi:hypothetical protein
MSFFIHVYPRLILLFLVVRFWEWDRNNASRVREMTDATLHQNSQGETMSTRARRKLALIVVITREMPQNIVSRKWFQNGAVRRAGYHGGTLGY